MDYAVRNPKGIATLGLASFPFARRYSENRCFFLFLRLLRCFSSAGSLRTAMYSLHGDKVLPYRVSPFGNLRVYGYLLLTAAYRSLSRPSSPVRAKASAIRPYLHRPAAVIADFADAGTGVLLTLLRSCERCLCVLVCYDAS